MDHSPILLESFVQTFIAGSKRHLEIMFYISFIKKNYLECATFTFGYGYVATAT